MKKLIIAANSTLNNSVDIYALMDEAKSKLVDRLSRNQFTDDWQWNEHCFQFVVCTRDSPMNLRTSDPYRFCYQSDEDWYGTAEEQLDNWLDRRFPR